MVYDVLSILKTEVTK